MTENAISRELRICLAIWRKAYLERNDNLEPVVINAANLNSAISIRQSMYRAMKPFRNGERFDEELRLAGDLFVCYLEKQEDPDARHRLILKPRNTLSALEADFENLGLNEDDLLLAEERMMSNKLAEFLDAPTKGDQRPATPYYDRRD